MSELPVIPHVIAGKEKTDQEHYAEVTNPALGHAVRRVPLADAAVVSEAVAAAEKALPAWRSSLPLVVDGGIRSASAIAVAISLGATLVGIGRPVMWALASGGEDGATELLVGLRDDLGRVLALLGAQSLRELRSPGLVTGSPHVLSLAVSVEARACGQASTS